MKSSLHISLAVAGLAGLNALAFQAGGLFAQRSDSDSGQSAKEGLNNSSSETPQIAGSKNSFIGKAKASPNQNGSLQKPEETDTVDFYPDAGLIAVPMEFWNRARIPPFDGEERLTPEYAAALGMSVEEVGNVQGALTKLFTEFREIQKQASKTAYYADGSIKSIRFPAFEEKAAPVISRFKDSLKSSLGSDRAALFESSRPFHQVYETQLAFAGKSGGGYVFHKRKSGTGVRVAWEGDDGGGWTFFTGDATEMPLFLKALAGGNKIPGAGN